MLPSCMWKQSRTISLLEQYNRDYITAAGCVSGLNNNVFLCTAYLLYFVLTEFSYTHEHNICK